MRNPWASDGAAPGVTSHGPNAPVALKLFAHRPLRRAQLKITNRRIIEQGVTHSTLDFTRLRIITHRAPVLAPYSSLLISVTSEFCSVTVERVFPSLNVI